MKTQEPKEYDFGLPVQSPVELKYKILVVNFPEMIEDSISVLGAKLFDADGFVGLNNFMKILGYADIKWHVDKLNDTFLTEDMNMPLNMMDCKGIVVYIVGDVVQNFIRIETWLFGTPRATSHIGCIGNVESGNGMERHSKSVGVNIHGSVNKNAARTRAGTVVGVENDKHLPVWYSCSFKHLKIPVNGTLIEKDRVLQPVFSGKGCILSTLENSCSVL
ncbi:hypothetical protein SLEP1_g44942 [Rubroshorea leprosula]|uniref:Uncharacterized protein n=1 Tax=Rubroshorea leprosula TaxID=152421 RepID=A0AAV5LHT1_9ROSI|nr:hypothetical protein SLEP1_g44942 [Rubroshorea leprosula]